MFSDEILGTFSRFEKTHLLEEEAEVCFCLFSSWYGANSPGRGNETGEEGHQVTQPDGQVKQNQFCKQNKNASEMKYRAQIQNRREKSI